MAIETIQFFGFSQMATSNWGAALSVDGSGWAIGTDWISLNSGAVIETLSVSDDDPGFGDDDFSQTLAGGQWLDGQFFASGTIIENEYLLTVQDSLGNSYQLAAVSMQGDGWNLMGYAYVGAQPPTGEPLTVTASQDSANMSYTPVCFTPGTLIDTDRGAVAVETLVEGDRIRTLDHGHQPLRVIARRQFRFGPGPHRHKPILIPGGSLGGGLPVCDLVVSPQHRILVADAGAEVLVPARALIALPGVREMPGCRAIEYVHLVHDRHEIVLANGAPTETLLPGPQALAGLEARAARRVLAAMRPGAAGNPARPILKVGAGRALVQGRLRGSPAQPGGGEGMATMAHSPG